jgi:hypothetical protein
VPAMRYLVLCVLIVLVAVSLWAAPPAARLKTIYGNESLGPRYIQGANVVAYLHVPLDSTGVPYSTHSGVIYSTSTPVDSSQTDANGKWAIRLPLTSDISPAGSVWHLTCTYRGQIRWDRDSVGFVDTTTECLMKVLHRAATCP